MNGQNRETHVENGNCYLQATGGDWAARECKRCMSSAISTEPVLGVFQQRVLVVVKLEKVVDDDDDDVMVMMMMMM